MQHPCPAAAPRPEGLSYPLSRHRCWGSLGCGRSTTMASRVASNSLASCTFAPANTATGGDCAWYDLPRSVGLGPISSPQNVLAHGSVCRLPFPVHAIPTRAPPQGLPTFGARRPSPPTVACRLFRQSVPLARCAAGPLSIRALAAPGFGRVFLQDDRFDPFPKLVRYFPDGL